MYWPGASDECNQEVERAVTTQTDSNTHRMVETNRWMINLQDEESSEVVCPCDIDITSEYDVINIDQSTFVTDLTYVITEWMLESTSG